MILTTDIKTLLQKFDSLADEITEALDTKKREVEKRKSELEELEMFSQYDPELLEEFFKRPYEILPRREEEWYLIVPKFIDLNVGYLTKSSDSFNVFIVNKYADYLGAVPVGFRRIFKFKPKIPLRIFDGMLLTGEEHQDTAWQRYSKFLTRREGTDKIRVKKGSQFDLIAKLISDGILPFIPKPVEKNHLIKGKWKLDAIHDAGARENIETRLSMPFFKEAFSRFIETGAVGIYWAMGVGKTLFGLEALSKVKVGNRPNLIISGASAALREQWKKNLALIESAADVEVETFQAWPKVKNRSWGLVIFDECHHLPAKTFSRLSTVTTEYRIGLSATPYREDQRTDYIFALTGFPIGLDWRVLVELGLIKEPEITLFLCDTYKEKHQKLAELLRDPLKTLIYCFSLDIGKNLGSSFGVPFVHGGTPVKDRLEIIKNSQTTIISAAGREGLSFRDIERTISYNFLFGSRQEETQFFGRLLHGVEEGHHIIMMTNEEYENYGKRLYGIQEKGFRIQVTRVGGGTGSFGRTRKRSARKSPPRPVVQTNKPKSAHIEHKPDTSRFPLLDERDTYSKKMLIQILKSEYASEKRGLTIQEIREILDHNHIKYSTYRKMKYLVEKMYKNRDLSARRDGTRRRYFLREGE